MVKYSFPENQSKIRHIVSVVNVHKIKQEEYKELQCFLARAVTIVTSRYDTYHDSTVVCSLTVLIF